MRIKYIIKIIFLFAICSTCYSQIIETKSLHFKSLSEIPEKVYIELDNVNNRITLKSSSNAILCLNGYTDLVGTIKVIREKFIFLQYKIRGGSGVKLEMSTLVCAYEGRLYKSLNVISREQYEFYDTYVHEENSLKSYSEKGLYILKINDLKEEKQNFQLIMTQYRKSQSKHEKNNNYEKSDIINFEFDKKNKVFFNGHVYLKGIYKIKNSKIEQKYLRGEMYPSVNLNGNKYIYFHNVWYNMLKGKLLEEY